MLARVGDAIALILFITRPNSDVSVAGRHSISAMEDDGGLVKFRFVVSSHVTARGGFDIQRRF